MTRSYSRLIAGLIICFFSLEKVQAQNDIYKKYDIYRNPLRVFLNKFSFTLTTGYSQTYYSHDLKDVYFFQNSEGQYVFDNDPESLLAAINGYGDWLNNPSLQFSVPINYNVPFDDLPFEYIRDPVNPLNPLIYALTSSSLVLPYEYLQNPVGNPVIDDQFALLNTSDDPLGFEGYFDGIPTNLQVHYSWRKFRAGIGYMFEVQFARSLEPTIQYGNIRYYRPNFKSSRFTRFYGMLGYTFYSWWRYDFVAEVNYGKLNAGSSFNKSLITRTSHLNLGVSIENNWSEYVRLIVKPSIDFKSYKVNVVDNITFTHRQPSFSIQVGLSINIPEIPRSPMKSDHTQLKHVYTDPKTGRRMEVRGQPIWKRQNPKIGENHRRPNQHLPSRKNKVKSKKRN